ncbi:MAG: hypothetical protein ABR999_11110 [Methanoregula sp.]|jgi:hypothetical protein|uniref:hypothetical protein n=1 Tax=Methanoregula sp. TaxID=2052170 RepID=UPI003D10FBC3
MSRTFAIGLVLLCLGSIGTVRADDSLLYFEAQGVAGYSTALKKTISYSQDPNAEMQKPSLGFDYLKRISGESGDVVTLALQGRMALTEDLDNNKNGNKYTLEPQIYNAYVKTKTPWSYVWVGHNRPAFGLSSYFDSHGLLLRTLAVQGFGYDRDWGGGLYRDFSWGDISASVTTGTGMPVRFEGNYMTAARISYGVQSRDNFNLGMSLAYGKTMDTIGYTVMNAEPQEMKMVGADLTILRNNLEHRFDLYAGTWMDQYTYALFYRFGINADQEGRLKIELQPTYWRQGDQKDYQLSLCLSSQVTSNLTARLGYTYDQATDDNRVLLQLYYYAPM